MTRTLGILTNLGPFWALHPFWWSNQYTDIYIYLFIYLCICICRERCRYVDMYLYEYLYLYIYIYMYICKCILMLGKWHHIICVFYLFRIVWAWSRGVLSDAYLIPRPGCIPGWTGWSSNPSADWKLQPASLLGATDLGIGTELSKGQGPGVEWSACCCEMLMTFVKTQFSS